MNLPKPSKLKTEIDQNLRETLGIEWEEMDRIDYDELNDMRSIIELCLESERLKEVKIFKISAKPKNYYRKLMEKKFGQPKPDGLIDYRIIDSWRNLMEEKFGHPEGCMETCQLDVPCPHGMDCEHKEAGRMVSAIKLEDGAISEVKYEDDLDILMKKHGDVFPEDWDYDDVSLFCFRYVMSNIEDVKEFFSE